MGGAHESAGADRYNFLVGAFYKGGNMAARVLVVDDDPATVELLQEFLIAKGYEVLTAHDGAEALRTVKEERPHLILLDITMPKMDGLEVLRQVKAIDPTVSVIMVTGVNEEAISRQAMELGAFDYIVKPLDLPYLEQSLWYKLTAMTL
jgi:DNA-binding response OmpR family regulator